MQDAMRNRTAAIAPSDRSEQVFRLAQIAVPPAAAWLAFSQSAKEHALDVLLGQGACGNLFMTAGSPLFLGHCLSCWSSGAAAGLAAFLAVAVTRSALSCAAAIR